MLTPTNRQAILDSECGLDFPEQTFAVIERILTDATAAATAEADAMWSVLNDYMDLDAEEYDEDADIEPSDRWRLRRDLTGIKRRYRPTIDQDPR